MSGGGGGRRGSGEAAEAAGEVWRGDVAVEVGDGEDEDVEEMRDLRGGW